MLQDRLRDGDSLIGADGGREHFGGQRERLEIVLVEFRLGSGLFDAAGMRQDST